MVGTRKTNRKSVDECEKERYMHNQYSKERKKLERKEKTKLGRI